MSSYFEHLTQDLYYEMQGDAGGRRLIRDCQAMYAQINETVPLIRSGSYETIVGVFKDCVRDWQKLKIRLLDCPHERVRRHCYNIETCGNRIRELLWLPVETDYEYLAKICYRLQRDMDYIFENLTLKELLAMPKPGVLLNRCREFRNQCGVFEKCVVRKDPYERMLAEYQQFYNRWNLLRPELAACKNQKIIRRLAECDQHIDVFGGTFGGGPVIDHLSMVQICAELDQYCLRLERLINSRIGRKYDTRFRDQICEHAENFRNSIHVLHEHAIANRRHDRHAEKDLKEALRHWRRLRPLIAKCNDQDRIALNQLRSKIEPLLAKLQVVYAELG